MRKVRKKILEEWYKETPIEINDARLKKLYELYDKFAFYGQLNSRIRELNELNSFKTIVTFNPYLVLPKNSHKCCGVSYHFYKGVKLLNLMISPWILSRLGNLNIDQLQSYLHADSMSLALLYAFEHELTHLMFSLWEKEDTVPCVHNAYFNCVHNSLFNDDNRENPTYDIVKILSSTNSYPPPLQNYTRYTYNNNSCYLDSLMTVLFFSKSNTFRDAIFTTNVNEIDYKNTVSKNKFFSPCTSGVTENEFVALVQNLQSVFFADYMGMINGDIKECRNARVILKQCYPDIQENGHWSTYSAAEVYDLLAHAFPKLLCYKAPYMHNKRIKTETSPRSMFIFWEFIEPPSDKQILWSKFEYETIVFRNGGYPAITNYGNTISEVISIPSYVNNKRIVRKEKIVKYQAFAEYIINDRYEMAGAIMLHGVSPGESGGSHYTAYVKIQSGKKGLWMKYNDIGNVWKLTKNLRNINGKTENKLGSFPGDDILIERNGIKPELYFYQRVKSRQPNEL